MIQVPNHNYPAEAYDLQRQYAAHVLLLRGYVRNASYLAEPTEDVFDLTGAAVKVREAIEVVGDFVSPPLAAYVDNVPMTLRTNRDPATGRYGVSLVAPSGTPGGQVRLLWPSKTLYASERLLIVTDHIDAQQTSAAVGDYLMIGLFPEQPKEVYIGGQRVPDDEVKLQNLVLQARVPVGATAGPILVVTEDRVCCARQAFSLPVQKKQASA